MRNSLHPARLTLKQNQLRVDLVHSPELAVLGVILPSLQLFVHDCFDLCRSFTAYIFFFAFLAAGFVCHCVCIIITGIDCIDNLTTG